MKSKQRLSFFILTFILFIFYLIPLNPVFGQEVLCYKERITHAPSFFIYTGRDDPNNPIIWEHNVPPGILDSVIRVGIYIEAYDVDYPSNDEHDRVYINGYDLGLLQGFNNQWETVEKTIPVSYIQEGINEIRIVVDELDKGWKVTVRASEIRFYCSTAEPDFSIGVSPSSQSIKQGESTDYMVSLTALNNFNSPVTLGATGLPSGATASFSQNPFTPTGESQLTISTSTDTPSGTYTLNIAADGGGKNHSKDVTLTIKQKPCPDFSIDFYASPSEGPAPLAVQFTPVITQPSGSSNNFTYFWDFKDGATSTSKNPTHTFLKKGTYNVSLTVKDPCQIEKTLEKEIKVSSFEGLINTFFNQSEALPGDEILFTIEVENKANFNYEKISIKDTLSPYFIYLEDNAPVKAQKEGNILYWSFPLLKKGEKISIQTKVRISDNCPEIKISNQAFLFHKSLNRSIESNKAFIQIQKIDIKLTKSVDKVSAKQSQNINYKIRINNKSSIPINNLNLRDTLSNNLEFISQNSELTFTTEANLLKWTGNIEPQREIIIHVQARIKDSVLNGTSIPNIAILNSSELEEEIKSNTVFTNISSSPIQVTRVKFSNRADIPQAEVGKIISFRLKVENQSDSPLLNPRITDSLPQGFSYVSDSSTLEGATFTEPSGKRQLLWKLPDIGPKQKVTLRFQTVIGSDAKRGKNVNTAFLETSDNAGQQIRLEASEFINISSSSFIFYSGVEGFVFLDRDGDEFFSMEDTPLKGIEVRLSTSEKTFSDDMGYFTFKNLFPGTYAIGINKITLPEKFRLASPYPKAIVLQDGFTENVEFALKFEKDDETKDARLEGRVFFDKNQDNTYNKGEPLLKEFQAVFDSKLKTKGKDGRFIFSQINEGAYTIEIKYDGKILKKEIFLKQGNNKMDFPIKFTGIKITIRGEQ
jgi:uncharacterized repeat protein (TIGR01451 family)